MRKEESFSEFPIAWQCILHSLTHTYLQVYTELSTTTACTLASISELGELFACVMANTNLRLYFLFIFEFIINFTLNLLTKCNMKATSIKKVF